MRRALGRAALAFGAVLVLVLALFFGYGLYVHQATGAAVAVDAGTIDRLTGLDGPVTIARDARGIPHIRASTDRDLFFADGYAMASDRLFQMDLTRRFVLGRLAELLGTPLLATDEEMRGYDIEELARRAYAASSPAARLALDAFAAGINAAAAREPTPVEYRALFFGFDRWRPQDAIAVGYATLLDLDDRAEWIIARDRIHRLLGHAGTDAFLPLTDPKYDQPTDGEPVGRVAPLPALPAPRTTASAAFVAERSPVGSNAWAAGAGRTTIGKAMLANDPHLSLGVPAVWWVVEGRSPGYHFAGAALVGTPGVTLGHDEHVAWGVTAGETAAMRLRREATRRGAFLEGGRWVEPTHRHVTIGVRFRGSTTADVLETPHGTVIANADGYAYLREWRMRFVAPVSPLEPFLALDRARTVEDGLAAVRALPEPALNVVIVDDSGRAAYHLAGGVPVDAAWSRWAVDGDAPDAPILPWDRAPHVAPSRSAFVETSNNRSDGDDGPRLAPFWPAPYRAYEIRRDLLRAGQRAITPAAFAAPQRDDDSPAELEFAKLAVAAVARTSVAHDAALAPALTALRGWNGEVVPASTGATVVTALRLQLLTDIVTAHLPPSVASDYLAHSATFVVALRALRERPHGWVPNDDWDGFVAGTLRRVVTALGSPIPAFGTWAAQPLRHPLAPFGFTMWNGPTLSGRGGAYAPAVQWASHGQSFRAVWIAGDWDAGTIDLDAGESGEPGSRHYTDQTAGWERFARTTLPFSDAAVRAATRSVLTLTPH